MVEFGISAGKTSA